MSLSGKIVGISKSVTLAVLEQLGVTINGSYTPFTPATISVTAGTGSPRALLTTESGSFVDNSGASAKAAVTLPSAAAGLRYVFRVTDTDGLRIVANTGDDIRIGELTSATAGYFESVRIGSAVELVAIDATTWQAIDGVIGTWRADSTTSSGYAFTPSAWQTWTSPTTTWIANVTWTGKYRFVGDVWEGELYGAISGAPTTASLTVTLPVTMSSNTVSGQLVSGVGGAWDNSPGAYYGPLLAVFASTTTVNVHYTNGTSTHAVVTQAAPITWAASDGIHLSLRAQVV